MFLYCMSPGPLLLSLGQILAALWPEGRTWPPGVTWLTLLLHNYKSACCDSPSVFWCRVYRRRLCAIVYWILFVARVPYYERCAGLHWCFNFCHVLWNSFIDTSKDHSENFLYSKILFSYIYKHYMQAKILLWFKKETALYFCRL